MTVGVILFCTFVGIDIKKDKDMLTNIVFLGITGHWEILIIVLVIVIVFGGKKIPELFKGVGQGMKEFKKATREDEDNNKGDAV